MNHPPFATTAITCFYYWLNYHTSHKFEIKNSKIILTFRYVTNEISVIKYYAVGNMNVLRHWRITGSP